jgi:hypothetical protein
VYRSEVFREYLLAAISQVVLGPVHISFLECYDIDVVFV